MANHVTKCGEGRRARHGSCAEPSTICSRLGMDNVSSAHKDGMCRCKHGQRSVRFVFIDQYPWGVVPHENQVHRPQISQDGQRMFHCISWCCVRLFAFNVVLRLWRLLGKVSGRPQALDPQCIGGLPMERDWARVRRSRSQSSCLESICAGPLRQGIRHLRWERRSTKIIITSIGVQII